MPSQILNRMDSCAALGHPMIDLSWQEKRIIRNLGGAAQCLTGEEPFPGRSCPRLPWLRTSYPWKTLKAHPHAIIPEERALPTETMKHIRKEKSPSIGGTFWSILNCEPFFIQHHLVDDPICLNYPA